MDLSGAALAGGLGAALLVYLLAYRRGIHAFRLIVIGIAVSALLGSINAFLIVQADLDEAMTVGFWGAGSVAKVTWTTLVPALALALVVFVAAALLAPAARTLELGDDAAVALGTRVGAARLGLLITGVATTALVTAAAGPIGFVALVSPQLARRLTRAPGIDLASAAAMGAALLSSAHLVSLVIGMLYRRIPVGLLTLTLGGIYLIWLIIHETRRSR